MSDSTAFRDGYRAHTYRRVLQALREDDLHTLEWGDDPILGECILVKMPNPSTDLVIACDMRHNHYEAFAAGSMYHTECAREPDLLAQTAGIIEQYFETDMVGEEGRPPLSRDELQTLVEDIARMPENFCSRFNDNPVKRSDIGPTRN